MVSGPVFMFCATGLVFGGTEGIGCRFPVLPFRACFRRYGGRRVSISCFAHPDSFSAVPRASSPAFMFCAPALIFGGTEGIQSRFHVLRAQTHFRRYRERSVPFSCFTLPDMFSAVPSESGPIFMFCAPGHVFGSPEGDESRSHVLRAKTHFLRCGGRRVQFSCFARPDSFSAVPSASGPVFMFCTPRLIFSCAEYVGSRFHILRGT
jgi:hypothetical protein